MSRVAWEGKYLLAIEQDGWEYAARKADTTAVVIAAIDAGHLLLIEQFRVPAGRRVLELPAGLVGDEGAAESAVAAAGRELEEETGYRADRIEDCGTFLSSPGMTSEAFTLVRATGLTRVGDGGGVGTEDIIVHRVALADVPGFIAERRAAGLAVDAKLLLFLGAGLA